MYNVYQNVSPNHSEWCHLKMGGVLSQMWCPQMGVGMYPPKWGYTRGRVCGGEGCGANHEEQILDRGQSQWLEA